MIYRLRFLYANFNSLSYLLIKVDLNSVSIIVDFVEKGG